MRCKKENCEKICIRKRDIHHTIDHSCLIFIAFLIILSTSQIVGASQAFNVEITIPQSYQKVIEGTDMWVTINIINLANSERMDVTLQYDIIDKDNKVLVTKSKTVAVETTASFVVDLKLPDKMPVGNYYVVGTVNSSLGQSISKAPFNVVIKSSNMQFYYMAAGLLIILIMIFVAIKSKPKIKEMQLRSKINNIVKQKLKNK